MFIYCSILLCLSVASNAQCPYRTVRNPPHSQGESFLFGDFPQAQKNLAKLMDNLLYHHREGVVEIDIPCSHILNRYFAILSPELAQEILLDTTGAYTKGSIERRVEKNIFPPEGLIWMPSNKRWEQLNTALFEGPFNPRCFPTCYAPIFHESFKWFIHRLAHLPQPFDLYRECTYYTMRTMTHAFFNYTLEDEELIAITDAFKFMLNFMHKRETQLLNIPLAAPLPYHRLFYYHRNTFNTILKKIIEHAPYTVTHHGISYPTIMGILTAHRDDLDHTPLTHDEIVSHVATLFFAAHDTTANFITMLIYYLTVQPAWYNALQKELREQYQGRSLQWIPLDTLTLYTHFKNEILRLFPSVPLVSMDTTRDVLLGNYMIPKHSTLIIALHTIQKHPDFFKHPHDFNPLRFDEHNDAYTSSTHKSLMPFNFGKRRCLGQWFAQAEAQHLVTHLLNHNITFTFEPHKKPLGLRIGLTGLPDQTIEASIHVPSHYAPEPCTYATHDMPMRIIAIRYENASKTIKTYRLAPCNQKKLPFTYHPGDHLEITAQNCVGQTIIRHYSISSSPTDSDEWLEITIKKESSDPTYKTISHHMHDALTEHDTLFVRAPMDDGVRVSTHDDYQRPLVLISGGIGITPIMSILRYCVATRWPGEVYCIHSCKTRDDCAFYQELRALSEHHRNIHLCIALTQEELADAAALPLELYYKGRINHSCLDSCIEKFGIHNFSSSKVYLCGTDTMCSELSHLLQHRYHLPASSVHHLSFGSFNWQSNAQNLYTREEVARHNTPQDAWIILDALVYDITKYIDKHPGFDIILDYLGKDATNAFNETPHSAQAKKILHQSDYIQVKGYIK